MASLLGACSAGGGHSAAATVTLAGGPFAFCWNSAGSSPQDVGVVNITNNATEFATITFSNADGTHLVLPAQLALSPGLSMDVTVQASSDFPGQQKLHYSFTSNGGADLGSGDIIVNRQCAAVGNVDVFFDRNGEIWVVPLDGSQVATPIVQDPLISFSGVGVRPSGSIVFSRTVGLGPDTSLWQSDRNGGGLAVELSVANQWLQMPDFLTKTTYTWSQGNDFDDGDIWYMDAGSTLQLTGTASTGDGDGFNDYDPSFGMVAGVDVIFFSRHDATNTTSDIYRISLDGTGLTAVAADPSISEDHPSYSWVNGLVAFERAASDLDEDDIWVMKPDGGGQMQVTSGAFDDDDPVWSPDGKWIIFERTDGPVSQIVRIPWPAATPVTVLAEGHAPAVRTH